MYISGVDVGGAILALGVMGVIFSKQQQAGVGDRESGRKREREQSPDAPADQQKAAKPDEPDAVMARGIEWFERFAASSFCVEALTERNVTPEREYWVAYLYTRLEDQTHRMMEVCLSFKHKVIEIGIWDYMPWAGIPEGNPVQTVRRLLTSESLGNMTFGFELQEDGSEPTFLGRSLPDRELMGGFIIHRRKFSTVAELYQLLESREFHTLRNRNVDV